MSGMSVSEICGSAPCGLVVHVKSDSSTMSTSEVALPCKRQDANMVFVSASSCSLVVRHRLSI
jgi:hypothetical protein